MLRACCFKLTSNSSKSLTRIIQPHLLATNNDNNKPHIRQSWTRAIINESPSSVQPYLKLLRIDKPIGTWLLYWPCTWSISLAAPAGCLPDLYLLGLFGAGAFLMRGAGCVINDMIDKDFDKKVERTKQRPLANGEVTPFQALIFLGGLLSVSLGILLQLNWYSVAVGASSMILVLVYPWCKRFTYWPQVVLGLTLNYGVLISWSHITNSIWSYPAVLPLYIACICHTVIYDTIYSHMDKSDDILIGVKSTALKFGSYTKPCLAVFGTLMTGGLTLTGFLCHQTWPFYCGVGLTAAQIAWQISTLKIDDPNDCWRKFSTNKYFGLILFTSIVLGNLVKQ